MRSIRSFSRLGAAATHLAASALVSAAVFAAILLIWYPGDLFKVAGGQRLFLIIVGVNIVAGPLITAIVFEPKKPGLIFDLWVIAALQLGALAFGLWVLFISRPVYIVFVLDRFEIMRANDYPESELARARASPWLDFPAFGAKLAAARMPPDPEERQRIMFLAPTGLDLQHMLQHYMPYDSVRRDVIAAVKPFARLRALNPGDRERLDGVVRDSGRDETGLGFLPMRAKEGDVAVIVDRTTGDVLRMLAINSWE
jgi:hypothetical protein